MVLLQLSAAQGPEECALAVGKALWRLELEAKKQGVSVSILEAEAGRHGGTFLSVLLALKGERAGAFAESWAGTIQWICQSPYRARHRRKNWFIGAFVCEMEENSRLDGDIRFETMRASGPGGQHVNKTESAVRAVHVATGITVKVATERSQQANKKLARLLIAHRLSEMAQAKAAEQTAQRRLMHYQVDRGNARRVFTGEDFVPAVR